MAESHNVVSDPFAVSLIQTKAHQLRRCPDFSESDYGCSTFARFLEAAHKAGHVKIVRDPKSGGYRVDSADSTADVGPIEEEAEARPRGAEAWSDPYLPDGVNQWVGKLSSKGVNPLASPSRMAILEAFVAVVRERVERKRKVNVQFVQDDVKKRIKKLRPDVPPRAVKAVFNALMRADILIHPDGNPVRSASAPFAIQRDALEINKALATVYLRVLYDTGAKLDDLALLSQLLFGVRDRQKEIGETLAWIATGGTEDEEDGDEIDLDALLSFDEDEGQGDEVEDDEAATPSRRRRRRKWEQDREAAAEDEPVAVEEAAAEPPEDDGGAEPEAPVEAEPAAEVPVVEDLPEVPSSTEELDALLTSD